MPKRAAPALDGQLPSMVVHGRYLRQPDKGSYVRPAVPSGEAVSVSETGFDAGGLLDWSVTRVAAGRLSRQDVKDRALLMISGETIARLKADAASLPLRQPLEQSSLRGGNFAENIFVSAAAGADSPCPDSLCVGDVLAVVAPRGSKRRCASSAAAESPTLRLQVSSPRRPCSKIDARFGRTWNGGGVRALCARTGLSGWFVRVLAPGELRDGDELRVVERPHPQWSLGRVSRLLYGMEGACDPPGGYALPTTREQVLSRWQGTLGELRELAGMPELARYEYRRELERLSAAVDEEPRRSCAVM
mmetsp:Transcript_33838/g.108005  ORF Transcript_33838/g.108005 Transcript_33838/m.108005 type:complete len:304 (+) Transcript_33838:62-973(+)